MLDTAVPAPVNKG